MYQKMLYEMDNKSSSQLNINRFLLLMCQKMSYEIDAGMSSSLLYEYLHINLTMKPTTPCLGYPIQNGFSFEFLNIFFSRNKCLNIQ